MKYYFFYGTQVIECEKPEIVTKEGIKANIAGTIYTLSIKPYITKAVILNVRD